MIERCCWLQLRVSMLDKKITSGHNWTEIDNASYISWTRALVQTLSRLGIEPKRRSGPKHSLSSILEAAE
jgi:hypothetical protein